ncbi:ATP-binding protein [Streptomyces racemochromogenes]|uniref:ATP-binding protein n=1 Tax=Streptomyces racemochromogenes TaxID=67353 RepID=A0ABW7P8E7_9ACTN
MGHPVRRRCVCGGVGAAARARAEVLRFVADGVAGGRMVSEFVREAALLVASEMVTNAIRHTRGPCTLQLAWAGDGVDIDVTDSSPHPPRARPPDPSGGGGFGWPLVNLLASEVEVRPAAAGGKTVHAHVPGVSPRTAGSD